MCVNMDIVMAVYTHVFVLFCLWQLYYVLSLCIMLFIFAVFFNRSVCFMMLLLFVRCMSNKFDRMVDSLCLCGVSIFHRIFCSFC